MRVRWSVVAGLLWHSVHAEPALAQASGVLTGTVVDEQTGLTLPYAGISMQTTALSTVSNAEGAFRLQVPPARMADTLLVQMLGYRTLRLKLRPGLFGPSQRLSLRPQSYALQAVSVEALSPTSLIKKAVRLTMGRMMGPLEVDTYYREFASVNGRYFRFADGLVDYYLSNGTGQNPRVQRQARVRAARVGQEPLTREQEQLD